MEKFTKLTGVAAPMPAINVDTDQIIPKQFLKTITRTGLGVNLFFDQRYDEDGNEKPDFLLNQEPYRDAKIFLGGANFGCGSSREHAPWAFLDFGIRAVIAPSFADIFFNNCLKNGILPIRLPEPEVERLMADARAAGAEFTVDLEAQTITRPDGSSVGFEIEPFHKLCLLNGLDDIALTLQKVDKIDRFEQGQRDSRPWLYA